MQKFLNLLKELWIRARTPVQYPPCPKCGEAMYGTSNFPVDTITCKNCKVSFYDTPQNISALEREAAEKEQKNKGA